MPTQVEKIRYGSMNTQESLCLPDRLELPHPSLSHPGRLMRLLSAIILILPSAVDRLWDQFALSNAIAAQFVGNDLSRLAAMASGTDNLTR